MRPGSRSGDPRDGGGGNTGDNRASTPGRGNDAGRSIVGDTGDDDGNAAAKRRKRSTPAATGQKSPRRDAGSSQCPAALLIKPEFFLAAKINSGFL